MTCRVELRPHEGVPVENEMTIFLGKVSIRFDFPGDEQNSVPPDVKSSALLDFGLLCSASPSNLNPKSMSSSEKVRPPTLCNTSYNRSNRIHNALAHNDDEVRCRSVKHKAHK